jgi:hypothetical protein
LARKSFVFKLGIILWILSIVLTGTYIRDRSGYSTDTDWLVMFKIIVFSLSAIVGFMLIRKYNNCGRSAKAIFGYVGFTALSIPFAESHRVVFGYWMLVAGVSLLTVGIVQGSKTYESLRKIEGIWLFIMLGVLLKDTILSLGIEKEVLEQGATRLGEATTNPGFMGLAAALAFWISFRKAESYRWVVIWVARLFFLFVIYSSRTRIVIISFIVAGLARMYFSSKRGRNVLILIICLIMVGYVSYIIGYEFNWGPVNETIIWFNRGQSEKEIESLTGRDQIWRSAITIVFKNPIRILFGHGYGASKHYLNWRENSPSFFASHCHNVYIEHLFSTGLFGLLGIITLLFVSTEWIRRNKQLQGKFPNRFPINAATVVAFLLVYSLTEITPLGRINPASILFLFYLAALDRVPYLSK